MVVKRHQKQTNPRVSGDHAINPSKSWKNTVIRTCHTYKKTHGHMTDLTYIHIKAEKSAINAWNEGQDSASLTIPMHRSKHAWPWGHLVALAHIVLHQHSLASRISLTPSSLLSDSSPSTSRSFWLLVSYYLFCRWSWRLVSLKTWHNQETPYFVVESWQM